MALSWLKRWLALRRAKKEESVQIPTLKELKREDKEFRKASEELVKIVREGKGGKSKK